MYQCQDCGHIFEPGEEKCWEEHHQYGDTTVAEQFSGCPICGEGYTEIKPCAICRKYPGEEYEEGELPNGGICSECFEDGIEKHFMEYLDSDTSEKEVFYLNGATFNDSYAFSTDEILALCEREYKAWIEFELTDSSKYLPVWRKFIEDGDADAFGEWLIKRTRKNDSEFTIVEL